MAADGLTTGGRDHDVVNRTTKKITRIPDPGCARGKPGGDVLIGSAGRTMLARARNEIRVSATPHPDDDSDCNGWANALADSLVLAAFDVKQPPVDGDFSLDGCFLIGWAGRLWYCGGDQYAEPLHDDYFAVGSGDMVALGALYAFAPDVRLGKMPQGHAVIQAVAAAARWKASVGGAVTIEHAEKPA